MRRGIPRTIAALLALLVFVCGAFTYLDMYVEEEEEEIDSVTLQFWYTDSSMTSYYNNAASYFNKRNEGITVVPVLADSSEYLDDIYNASVAGTDYPDIYVISDVSLGKAYLAGLTVPVTDEEMEDQFPFVALTAVTYEEKIIGYPFYFDTSTLVYNETYLQQIANGETDPVGDEDSDSEETAVTEEEQTSEEGTAEGETAGESETAEEETVLTVEDLVPETVDDLLTLASNYNAPDTVESLFKWDVNDVFYNYYFVGAQMTVDGSVSSDVDINTEGAISCLEIFQQLTEFFYIDPDEVDADSILEEFLEGKVLFTIMDTSHALELEAAAEEGIMEYAYGYSVIPDPTQSLAGAALAVTETVVVNGYTEYAQAANAFAKFLTCEYAGNLYANTGHISANSQAEKTTELEQVFFREYERSTCLPKNPAAGNFWMLLENTFSNVWEGESIESELITLEDAVKAQYAVQ
ncbi:MAG: extracellular solute-binding protein [Lachnospiraceae bacterium]|nr:extracellular solute-binding protein [Lachnospiraceae bacterium]